jgi:general stress protein YciG
MTQTAEGNKRKGFASLGPEKRREIASRGGKAAQARGTGHKWTSETAAIAGRLGVRRKRERRRKEATGTVV